MILWILRIVLALTFVREGSAPHYGEGVMEQVARNRGLPIVDCMISTPYDEPIGTWLYVTNDYYHAMCRVSDVSAPKDKQRHIDKGYVVELNFNSAKRFCNIERVGQEPPWKCKVQVWRYANGSGSR